MIGPTLALVDQAAAVYRGTPDGMRILDVGRRLNEPLRVAVIGRVKAGKSTLLNALAGARLAPTDAGECTRIVTWYVDGPTYRVAMYPTGGAPRSLRFTRTDSAIDVDLGGMAPEQISRLRITWPSAGLRNVTLIDTPGVGSLSETAGRRAPHVIAPPYRRSPADAVLYLLRHLHSDDVEFLRAFHDPTIGRADPVNAIGVLSRADEIGAGRPTALSSARTIAARMSADPAVRRMVQTVVPVAGLLGETAATLTEAEFGLLRLLADADKATADRILLTVDRFIGGHHDELVLTPAERAGLLDRFGLFGLRLITVMLRHRVVGTASELATELNARSGLTELREVLGSLFLQRAEVLKSRSALLALAAISRDRPQPGSEAITIGVERLMASAHPLNELRVLSAVRSGAISGRPEVVADLEQLIGGSGVHPAIRLGLPADTDSGSLRAAAADALERWHRRVAHPMTDRRLADAGRVVIRSCEGLIADLSGRP